VFKGYWQMPKRRRKSSPSTLVPDRRRRPHRRAGYVPSSDAARTDHQRGLQRLPAEVEGVLNDMPGVAESAVIGVPHADFGEAVVAVVVARAGSAPDAMALITSLKEGLRTSSAQTRLVVEELPRNTMGKVQKNLLREQHKTLFAA